MKYLLFSKENILNHSVLSPLLNSGLLTPQEVLTKTLDYCLQNKVPINSCEGFIRQIIGWRELPRLPTQAEQFLTGTLRPAAADQQQSHEQETKAAWFGNVDHPVRRTRTTPSRNPLTIGRDRRDESHHHHDGRQVRLLPPGRRDAQGLCRYDRAEAGVYFCLAYHTWLPVLQGRAVMQTN